MNGVHRITHNHLSLSISPSLFLLHPCLPYHPLSTSFSFPLSHPSFRHLFIVLLLALHSLHLCLSDPSAISNIFQLFNHHLSHFFPFPFCTSSALCPVILSLFRLSFCCHLPLSTTNEPTAASSHRRFLQNLCFLKVSSFFFSSCATLLRYK